MTADIVFSLVDRIYTAAEQPARWQDFANELSRVLGDAAVALPLQLPGHAAPPRAWSVHIRPEYIEDLGGIYPQGLPWTSTAYPAITRNFRFTSDFFPDEDLPQNEFYLEWMKPQGLAPEGALIHCFACEGDTPLAEIAILRRQGCRPITDDDRLLCDQLAPHLASAFRLYRRFGGEQHEHLALAEVVNRLQLGVILLDRERRPVVTNRSADRLVALGDGLTLREDGLHAQNPRDDAVMQKILNDAIAGERGGTHVSSLMAIARPSGKRSFPIIVSSLLEAGAGDVAEDAVASLLIGDPHAGHAITPDVLRNLYELTPAESELVGLLANGQSLMDAAEVRGVKLNTVRSQLKQVFAKTETNRQAQLIRLVLTGAAEFPGEGGP